MKLKRITFARVKSRYGDSEPLDIRDMLRYDIAFQPKSDPSLVAFPVFHTRGGDLGGKITHDRWRTYGFIVTEITDPATVAGLKFGMNREDFTTYRHVAPDYRRLVQYTLAQYIAAPDLAALDKIGFTEVASGARTWYNVTNSGVS